ncbi:MAG: DegV family protein [Clostridia bacterium]|nr:DegV family protein [Clostridia bacterium]MBQ2327330.1 DegV family protein [Clostridia bacterium]
MSVKIITDTSADLNPAEAKALGVGTAPMKVMFGEEEYTASFGLTGNEFYQKLETAADLPTTSQPSVARFEELFASCPEDDIVVILIASALSGTVQSATIAAQSFPKKNIYIIDSGSATLGQRILVERAVQLRDMGLTGDQIAKSLEYEKNEIVLLAVIDTLKYLHKGGRLSKTAAIAGGLLGIKPVITLKDGVIEVLGKERGTARALRFLHTTAEGFGKPDMSRPSSLAYTGCDPSVLEPLIAELGKDFISDNAVTDHIGPTIGVHVGPGAIGIAYFRKN